MVGFPVRPGPAIVVGPVPAAPGLSWRVSVVLVGWRRGGLLPGGMSLYPDGQEAVLAG